MSGQFKKHEDIFPRAKRDRSPCSKKQFGRSTRIYPMRERSQERHSRRIPHSERSKALRWQWGPRRLQSQIRVASRAALVVVKPSMKALGQGASEIDFGRPAP
jgi:hypothetical protein